MTSDNLKDINGIGPKTLKTLKDANINTLEQLSTLSVYDLEVLDGIGTTKAKQFINEAKKKLKNSEGLSKGNYSRKKHAKEVIESKLLPKLKRDIMKGILDSDIFQDLIREGIQNHLREQEGEINEKIQSQSEQIAKLQGHIKRLETQLASLRVSLAQEFSLDDVNEEFSNQEKEGKHGTQINLQVEESLEIPESLKSQKPRRIEKDTTSQAEEIISKPIQELEDIENYIKNLLKPGESIEVDELIKKEQLQIVSLSKLKNAIYTLIDKEIITPAESSSSVQKINGKIGRLTRIK